MIIFEMLQTNYELRITDYELRFVTYVSDWLIVTCSLFTKVASTLFLVIQNSVMG